MPETDDWPDGRPGPAPRPEAQRPRQDGKAAAGARMAQQHTWVDLQVRQAIERGEFDDLPGAGKPIELDSTHDPNWWIKKLVERENVALLPPSLALRKEDAELDARLDKLNTEGDVRKHLNDFNERVIAARYRLPEGPPLITMPRDVDAAVEAWAERRSARLAAQREAARRARAEGALDPARATQRKRWWRRG